MTRAPKFEFLPDQQADFPVSVSADGPWYLVVSAALIENRSRHLALPPTLTRRSRERP
jgi:hypothetical protein